MKAESWMYTYRLQCGVRARYIQVLYNIGLSEEIAQNLQQKSGINQ